MGEAILTRKGGMNLDAVIEEYYAYAGEEISAGSFVEFVQGSAGREYIGESSQSTLATKFNSSSKNFVDIITLNENLMIARSEEFLQAILISGTTITTGSYLDSSSVTSNDTYYILGIAKISDTSFVCVYNTRKDSNSSTYVKALIYSVDTSGKIIKNNDTTIADLGTGIGWYVIGRIVSLGDGRFVVMMGSNNISTNTGMRVMMFNISGINTTLLYQSSYLNDYDSGAIGCFKLIKNDTILYVNYCKSSMGSDGGFQLRTINIVGNQLVINPKYIISDLAIGSDSLNIAIEVDDIGENLIILSSNTKIAYLSILNKTTFILNSSQAIDPLGVNSSFAVDMVKIDNNNFIVVLSSGSVSHSYRYQYLTCIYTVDWLNKNTTFGTFTKINSTDAYKFSLIRKYKDNNYMAALFNSYLIVRQVCLNGDIVNTSIYDYIAERQVKNASSKYRINGLAKTGGRGGTLENHNESIKIYTLSN